MAAVGNPMQRGIQLSKISPEFLHANSTSHTWAFSAFAELIDNAYDPDVSASELLIDKLEINGHTSLIFLDNGAGMDTDKLLKMLSFGFCDKHVYERASSHLPIGHYGNGFKSGSMRLAKDALVFTRCQNSASIGFLSQGYLKAIEADSVFIPIVTYRLPKLERIKSEQSRNNLNAILKYSVFCTEQDLKEELHALEGSMTGTKIILSNLRRLQDGTLELDFSSDETDIRCPEAHEVDLTSVYHRPVQLPTSEYKHSLREYCSILFLRPRMKITIRGKRVKSRLISKSLSSTEIDSYKPTWLNRPLKITFGFACQKTKTEDYGMMLYHRNRLIKAFEKVGYQKQPNDLGIGVVGVAQVDFLQPTHNKQDFNKDEKFNSVMMAFANKLNDYWNEKKQSTPTSLIQESLRAAPDWTWAQCEMCLKWRRLPDGVNKDSLPEQWFCRFNPDATHNRCEIPEEPEDEDQAVKSTYVKTFKRKREEKKRLEMIDRTRQDVEMQMLQERDLRHRPLSESLPAVNNLQRALAEAKQREEEQKRLIMKMQVEKTQIEARLAESLKLSKLKRKNQTVMALPSDYPGNSNVLTPFSKRKADNNQDDSSRSAKIVRSNEKIEHQSSSSNSNNNENTRNRSSPANGNSERNSKNCITPRLSASASSSTPLKVKIGGLINKINKLDPKACSNKEAKKAASSPSKNNETFVDLTEDIDYEITINEDYDSDEDIKPVLNELKAGLVKNEKKRENETDAADVKSDALDHKSEEKPVVFDKEPRAAGDDAFPDVKEELPEKETTMTAAIPSADNPHVTFDNNGGDGGVPSLNHLECDDVEMPSENMLSSNVNIVMAALENKFKKSLSRENETVHDIDNDKQCININNEKRVEENDASEDSHTGRIQSSTDQIEKEHETAEKESENIEKESDDVQKKTLNHHNKDIIEIYSDDDNDGDFDCGGVTIKKEIVEEEAGQDKHHEENKTLDNESREIQSGFEDYKKVVGEDGDNMETQLDKEIEAASDQLLFCRKGDKDRCFGNGYAANAKAMNKDAMDLMEGESEISIPYNNIDRVPQYGSVDCVIISGTEETATSVLKSGDGNIVNHNDSSANVFKDSIVHSKRTKVYDDENTGKLNDSDNDISNLSVDNLNTGDYDSVTKIAKEAKHVLTEVEISEGETGGSDEVERIGSSYCDNVQQEKEMVDNDKSNVEGDHKMNFEKNESHSKLLYLSEQRRGNDALRKSHSDEDKRKKDSCHKCNLNDETVNEASTEDVNLKEDNIIYFKKDRDTQSEDSKINEDKDGKNSPCQEDDSNYYRGVKKNIIRNENISNGDKLLERNSEHIHCENVSPDPPEEVERDTEIISRQRFHGFLNDVHRLLGLLCPDAHLGGVNDIEQTVRAMIEIHLEGSQSQGL